MRKIFYIFILTSNILFAQTSQLDTNVILIGDQINLYVSAKFEKNEKYHWPIFEDSVFNKIEIIHKSELEKRNHENSVTVSQKLTITSFDSGSYYIPPFIFNDNKRTKGIIFTVTTINITDSSQIIDISTPLVGLISDLNQESKTKRWEIAIWILCFLLIIAGLIYFLKKIKLKKKKNILIPKKKIPAHIIALKKLQKLDKQRIWEKEEIKEYYSQLSLIIREYLENRFHFNALEMPTSDIIHQFTKINIEKLEILNLESMLRKSDNIKYAKGASVKEEGEKIMKLSIQFVKNTKIEDVK